MYNVPYVTHSFNGMPYRLLGRSGLRVSAVGLGTWKFGFPETGDGARVEKAAAFQIMDRAIELGVTFWDTANRYNAGSGNSERVIGEWLQNNPDQRRNIVLATKVYGGMDGITPNHSRLSRGNILDSVYACLKRLRVDTIDLLYFHTFDHSTPVEESLAAVEDLVSQDLVRYFAVSNFTVDQLKIYRAAETVRTRMLAIQNGYNLLDGESHKGVLQYAAENHIDYVAWGPLAKGLLTERYLDLSNVGKGDRLHDEGTLESDASENKIHKVQALNKLAQSWGMTVSQMVLQAMLQTPGMGPVIPSSSSVSQLEANATAGTLHFDPVQLHQINQLMAKDNL